MKTRNYIALIVLLAMMLGLVAAVGLLSEAKRSFEDVPETHWAYPYIERAYHDGIVVGTKAEGEKRWFEPDAPLTVSAWTVILCHIFYPGEEEAYPEETWYSRQQSVLEKHGVFDGDTFDMNAPCTRYQMAMMTYNIIKDLGLDGLPYQSPDRIRYYIVDYDTIPEKYQTAVFTIVFLEIASGVSSGGQNIGFCGDIVLTRAQAATLYYNIAVHIFEYPEVLPEPTYGEVGTLSDEEVVMSLETHHWVNDYWSEQPPEIQAIISQDVFNCMAQTIIDYPMISRTIVREDDVNGNFIHQERIKNDYYNYACYNSDEVTVAPRGICLSSAMTGNKQQGYISYFTPYVYVITPEKKALFDRIIASAGSNPTDRDIVFACFAELEKRFDYREHADIGVDWTDTGKYVSCGACSNLMREFLAYADIPAFDVRDYTQNHAWVEARIDGKWMVVDASLMLITDPETGIYAKEADTYNNNDIYVWTSYEVDVTLMEALLSYYPSRAECAKYN